MACVSLSNGSTLFADDAERLLTQRIRKATAGPDETAAADEKDEQWLVSRPNGLHTSSHAIAGGPCDGRKWGLAPIPTVPFGREPSPEGWRNQSRDEVSDARDGGRA